MTLQGRWAPPAPRLVPVDMSATTHVIVVTTPWCHHCRAIAPLIDELEHRYARSVRVDHLDASEQPDRAAALGVSGTPTLIAVVDGVERRRIVGRVPDADIEQFFTTSGEHRPFPVDGLTRGLAAAGVVTLGVVTAAPVLLLAGAALTAWTAATMWRWAR